MFVPVVDQDHRPLMPTIPSRARRLIRSGEATPFWDRGVFCIRLNREPSARNTQPVIVGIDPGSKREGLSVVSAAHVYLNVQAAAVDWVKDAVETRRNMRRARRFRKTPCRQNRKHRARGGLPPSTKARWQWKLRLARWLSRMFPVWSFIIEDVKAKTRKGGKLWNAGFSPLAAGKVWLYDELEALAPVEKRSGWETKLLRDAMGLKKTRVKTAEAFSAHCVDAFALARSVTGGPDAPDNTALLVVTPLRFHRRQLHRLQPEKGGKRKAYGGTRSLGFKRGGLVRHPKWGIAYVGGWLKDRISLHSIETGKRLTQGATPADCRFLCFNSWRFRVA